MVRLKLNQSWRWTEWHQPDMLHVKCSYVTSLDTILYAPDFRSLFPCVRASYVYAGWNLTNDIILDTILLTKTNTGQNATSLVITREWFEPVPTVKEISKPLPNHATASAALFNGILITIFGNVMASQILFSSANHRSQSEWHNRRSIPQVR